MKNNYALIDLHLHLDGSLSLASVKVTVNTDNMTVSNTTVAEEQKHLDLAKEEMYLLAKNAVEAAFADAGTKEWLKKEVEKRFL